MQVLRVAPFLGQQIATVTFLDEPSVIRECRPQRNVRLPMPPELVSSEDDSTVMTVDCDFYGITPLYHPVHPEKPKFE